MLAGGGSLQYDRDDVNSRANRLDERVSQRRGHGGTEPGRRASVGNRADRCVPYIRARRREDAGVGFRGAGVGMESDRVVQRQSKSAAQEGNEQHERLQPTGTHHGSKVVPRARNSKAPGG
jgi:hypothetical protein